MDSSAVWNQQDPTLSVPSQDDFQQFLDMGMNNLGDALQFDFPDFNNAQPQAAQLMHRSDGETGMEENQPVRPDTTMQEAVPAITTATSHPGIHRTAISHAHRSNESLADIDAQIHYLHQQRAQQEQRQLQEQQRNYYAQNRMIPPTPNSMEMRGSGHFYSQSDPQQQAMYERFQMHVKEQEVCLEYRFFHTI